MKKINYQLVLATLCLGLTACQPELAVPQTSAPAQVDYSKHPRHQFFQSELDTYRKVHNAPGALMLVKSEANGLWVGASGKSNLEHGTDMQGTERIRVGSITKPMTATIILKLKEQGKLKLDDKLGDWLPQTQGNIPKADQITLRQLLSHTSGIRNLGDDNISFKLALVNRPADVDMTRPDEILKRYVYGKPLAYDPGTHFLYSNTGFMLLGMIAEKATQKPLKALYQEFIFTPAGMSDSYIEKRDDPRVARSYLDLYGDGKLIDVGDWEKSYDDGGAAGGVITTVTDLLKFSEALHGGKLLNEQSISEMKGSVKLPSCPNGDCEYGLALSTWNLEIGTGYGHDGGVVGIDALWLYFPERKSTIILFINRSIPTDKRIIERVL
ncbi:serine hydrolase domain-containing protein [Telluribacter humicola]|uniref:serine hydrolase domain-containing protein n=1 Tax=Telluribacter humicola TaxID=1720261 RepID=UPI001A96AFA3|nr:serine hydrolase domain-containing protein [Telluribacter humicola]